MKATGHNQGRARLRGRWGMALMSGLLCMGLWGTAIAQQTAEEEASGGSDHDRGARAEVSNHAEMERALEPILSSQALRGVTVGLHVEDVRSGEVLYSYNADRLMNPASNVKMMTAAVILEKLGPSHTFRTELSTGEFSEGRVENLYVRGEGEAFLLFDDVLSWAGQLRLKGVEEIEGDLVIDDGIFAGEYLPPGFDMRDVGAAYRSPIGAVSVNFNAVTAIVEPADEIGSAPKVRLHPPNTHVQVVNRARTVGGRLGRVHVTAEVDDQGGTTLVVGGTIGVQADPVSQRKRIEDPPAFAGSVIAEALSLVGIEFEGVIRRGEAPESPKVLLTHRSRPMMDVVSAMNKWSNNFMAEQLWRGLGVMEEEPSTWEASRMEAKQVLESKGWANGSYRWFNGSGLYDGNEVSARQFVELLKTMYDHRYGPEFMSSLAIAGVDGTMAHRLGDDVTKGNLRAKTGTLRDVAALSGYVRTKSGRLVAFSILFNDTPRRAWNYRNVQDDLARAIAEFEG